MGAGGGQRGCERGRGLAARRSGRTLEKLVPLAPVDLAVEPDQRARVLVGRRADGVDRDLQRGAVVEPGSVPTLRADEQGGRKATHGAAEARLAQADLGCERGPQRADLGDADRLELELMEGGRRPVGTAVSEGSLRSG